jgi:hypothetical protein
MTSIAVWVGVDTHGPASAYIATDSRISWPSRGIWDSGRKAFASSSFPDIFGYCGDVLFPSLLLSQFVTALDIGAAVHRSATTMDRAKALEQIARITMKGFPNKLRQPFEIIYCGRDGEGLASRFEVQVLSWSPQNDWHRELHQIPTESSTLVFKTGSGSQSIAKSMALWNESAQGGTSRAVYSAFVEALRGGSDPNSGGPPQLVALYRKWGGRTVGVINQGKRYLHGLPVLIHDVDPSLEWRNELFERCDGRTGRRVIDAQRHTSR